LEQPTAVEVTLKSRVIAANAIRRMGRRLTSVTEGLVVIAMFGTACSDQTERITEIVAPTARPALAQGSDEGRSIHENTSVHWNEIARILVASHNTNAPMATRVYALTSVAQFRAVVALDNEHGVSLNAAIARASANVLTGLYPDAASAAVIAAALEEDEPWLNGKSPAHSAPAEGDAIGAQVAQAVLAGAASDGAAAANCPATPPLPPTQFWHDDAVPPNPQPLLPCFGKVRTWLGIDVTQFRADPPPAFGSPAFLAGLAEVRQISDTRTAAQLATVDKWLDGSNSFTPPGRWNLIASDLVTQHHLDAADAARIFAVLNIAMMDTHIACWDRKYWFWELRPWQADPLITTPRGQPHHPANPSGHACAGGAGSGTLAGFFPTQRDSLLALGDEAGFSTVLSGVHFRFDVDKGLAIGRDIAARALAVPHLDDLMEDGSRP
jgi:hypothetical protein